MDTDVVIAGGGPTGLMLACELRLAGVDVVIADRLPDRGSTESRAGGLHARTLEVFDQRGLLDEFLKIGRPIQAGHFGGLRLDFSGFETRYPYMLVLLQNRTERLLEDRAAELGVRVRWSSEVTGLRQDETGVDVQIGGERVRAKYLVGCDGGRSAVRKLAGIDFPGTPASMSSLLGDVELSDPPSGFVFQERREHGNYTVMSFEPGWYRVMTSQYDRVADRDEPMTIEVLREAVTRIAGTDFGMHSPRWVSRFNDASRLAAQYRSGRVFLTGDAAHIFYPAGGQGLNTGVQDAVNLGWKLAAVVRGQAPEELLDSYHTERHPVGARVVHNTRAQIVLSRSGQHIDDLRAVLGGLIEIDAVNRSLGGMVTGLDIRYPMSDIGTEVHPLVGHRMPDLDLKTADSDTRVAELLHAGRPVLLDLGAGVQLPGGWADRVDIVQARSEADQWAIPVIGQVPAAAALLIRPDGHIAWASTESTDALRTALTTWFGPARVDTA